jgi:hypothetical protein
VSTAARLLVASAGLFSGGCTVFKVAAAPVKVAASTIVVAGETAGTVVTTTGRVTVAAVRTTGTLAGAGLEAVARLGQSGTVTFVDAASGALVRVPWKEGLTLARGGEAAKMRLAGRVVQVVRAGQVVAPEAAATLRSGDVVRVTAKGAPIVS